MYIHTYIYTYIHTYIHAYIYTLCGKNAELLKVTATNVYLPLDFKRLTAC
jgi:hypothetical protein